ncbi:putative transporter [Colletotrichum sp. SAR11_240]|nr:putative transporter [Colletotrichum sp. SAR11_240]
MAPRNVLLLVADDLGKQLGCYGNPYIKTPNIDKLAAEGLHTHQNGQYGLNSGRHHFMTFDHIESGPALLSKAGVRTGIIGKIHVGPDSVYPWEWRAESLTRDVWWSSQRAAEFFKVSKEDGRPFVLTVGYHDPHRDRTRGGFGNDEPVDERINSVKYHAGDMVVPGFLSDTPGVRHELAGYAEAISRLDQGIGMILHELEASGFADDTLVIFISDNGPPFLNSKTTLYDAGVCLPLIIKQPRSSPAVNPNLVSYVDVLPTILDWVLDQNSEVSKAGLAGRSFLDIISEGQELHEWDHVFGSHTFHESTNYWPTSNDIDTKTHSFEVDSPKEGISDLAEPQDTTKSVGFWEALTRRNTPRDLDSIATECSVFDDPNLAPFYQPPAEYENVHRFDPQERWTYREEQRVRRKTDLRIFAWILVMFFGLNIDRGNLGNAAADNLLKDLNINTNDYNNAQNMYRIGFLIAEIPSQMIGKRLGPDRWIPVQIILWSFASGGQFFMHNRAGFFACRFLIGLFMGGFIPDSILYLSYFYKKTEMPIRLALFWFVDSISGVIASFMAYGILHMRGVAGKEGWRWLFLIEALVSFVIGALSFLFLVPGPTQTKTWWNPKGYFTEREEKIIVNRVLRDDPSKSDMHNRESLTLGMLWKSLKDYDLWPIYLIGILFEIPTAPPKTYLTLSLKALGFSTFNVTLLAIPVTVFAAVNMLWVTFLTERFHQIAIIGLLSQVWVLPLLIVEYTSIESLSPWAQYAVTFMILGQPSTHAAHVGWCSRLSNSVRTRAISAALYNITIQLSGIASSNIYREDDKPHYHRGNKNLIAITVATIFAYAFAKAYYTLRNKSKRDRWNAMSDQEQAAYLNSTTDEGNKRLDFFFDS